MSGRAAGKGNGEVVLGLLAMAEAAWTEAMEHGVPPLEAYSRTRCGPQIGRLAPATVESQAEGTGLKAETHRGTARQSEQEMKGLGPGPWL